MGAEWCQLGTTYHALQGAVVRDEEWCWDWLHDVTAALTALHGQDEPLVHGDVKPANVYLGADGRYRLGDFGLTAVMHQLSEEGDKLYLAPELLSSFDRHDWAPPADLFALGLSLFELITGLDERLPAGDREYHALRAGDGLALPVSWGAPAGSAGSVGSSGSAESGLVSAWPVSPALTAVVAALLAREPRRRPTAAQVLGHPAVQAAAARLASGTRRLPMLPQLPQLPQLPDQPRSTADSATILAGTSSQLSPGGGRVAPPSDSMLESSGGSDHLLVPPASLLESSGGSDHLLVPPASPTRRLF